MVLFAQYAPESQHWWPSEQTKNTTTYKYYKNSFICNGQHVPFTKDHIFGCISLIVLECIQSVQNVPDRYFPDNYLI